MQGKVRRFWMDVEDARSFYTTNEIDYLRKCGARDGWYEEQMVDGTTRRSTSRGPLPALRRDSKTS